MYRKEKFNSISRVILLFSGVFILLSGCFFSAPAGKLVTPEIRALGLPDASVVGSVTLKVTGPDMEPVEVSYSQLPSVINIAIPEGNNRTFELSVGLAPAFITASSGVATSYKGTATANITSDSAVVTLHMGIGSTKLVVPDTQNNRVLQFDDISGANETKLSATDNPVFGAWLTTKNISFTPYDIDFDSEGRIYIANNGIGEGIIRIDNIVGLNPHAFGVGYVKALSVDRVNNHIYYTDGQQIYRNNFDGTGEVTLDSTSGVQSIQSINGMAVGNNGYIYIAGSYSTTSAIPAVFKYNPSSQIVVDYTVTNLSTPWDVMVKNDKLYVANLGGIDGWKIVRFNKDLTSPIGYGIGFTPYTTDTTQDHFYGPRRFVAILNKKITIIDDSDGNGSYDKLVSIDDITGTNWETLPDNGDGQGLFSFYSYC